MRYYLYYIDFFSKIKYNMSSFLLYKRKKYMEKESILGFNVCTQNVEKLQDNIFNDYKNNNQLFVVNINPEIITTNYKNKELKDIFNQQKYQIPDGAGVVWASKRKKGNIKKRITGIDLMMKICDKSQEYSPRIFLYGGKEKIAKKAADELKLQYPQINIAGTCNGYEDENKVIDKIQKSNADILFVGIGSPKQEEFIIKNKDKLKNVKILMPVGGSFDVISKTKKRAPKCIIKMNLEWLYRLVQEPKRILRQIKLIKFIFMVIFNKEKVNEKEK